MGGEPSARTPTLTGVGDVAQARRSRWCRRVGVGVLLLVVVVACTGWLGPRDRTVSGEGLSVTYPHVTRSGIDSMIEISVDQVGAGPVVVDLPSTVVDRLGVETISPQPMSEVSEGDVVRLTFEQPRAGAFAVQILGRLPVRADLGPFAYSIRISPAGMEPQQVSARTWVLP